MTAVLILMAAFASCDKDKGGSGGTTGDNPFVGTWISEDDDGETLEVTETMWVVKYENNIILKGSYTYKGNSANLTVTYVIDEDAVGLAVGDVGTAKISDGEITVTFDGLEKMVFTKEGGGNTGDNLFVGTWISEDDEGDLEVTETMWMIKYENTTILKGNYTYKGNSANLTVTYVIDEDAIGLAAGDVGTAKVSGEKMTVTFYGEDMVFIKKGGGGGGDAFVVTAKNVIGGSSDIATVAGLVEGEYDEGEIASAPYKNNGFELKLPATVANKYLWNINEDGEMDDMISDKNAKVTDLWIEALDSDKDYIGEFYYEDEGNDYYAAALYLYADRDFTIKGSIYEEWDGDYYKMEWNCTFKKGWNILYMFEDNGWDEYYTTTKPSNVNLKWYFYGGDDGKTLSISPKHKKAGFEKFRAVK